MATSSRRQQESPSSLILPVLTVGAAAAMLLAWNRYPGVAVLWLAVIAASFSSKMPVLSGPKDASGYPTEGNAAESKKVATHRFWKHVSWRLIVPNKCWLPTSLNHLIAFGVALIVATLPTDRIGNEWAYVDAALTYVLVVQVSESKRLTADLYDEQPHVSVKVIKQWLAGFSHNMPKIVGTFLAAIVAGFATAIALRAVHLDWLIWPAPVTGVGVAVVVFSAVLYKIYRPEVIQQWQWTREARTAWNFRWETVAKLKTKPNLITHERFLDGTVWVDTFQAPAEVGGAKAVIEMRSQLLPAMPADTTTAFISVADVDQEGQPKPGTRHMLNFQVVNWANSTFPDLADPASDPKLVGLWAQMCMAIFNQEQAQYVPILVGDVEPLHETLEEGQQFTAAWESKWTVPEYPVDEYMPMAAEMFTGRTGYQCTATEDRLYLGPVREESTPLRDPSLRKQLEQWDEEALWSKRWYDALPLGYQKPYIQTAASKTVQLATGQTVSMMPFMVGQGMSPQEYFDKTSPEKLATTLGSAPFVTLTGFQQPGGRPGERHPAAFSVVWSETPVPSNPAKLTPADPRTDRGQQGAKFVLTGVINQAFQAAKMPRPEVVSATALTDPAESREHIWDINIRLYDGVTLASVKTNAEKLRLSLGSDWLRVTPATDGCRIVVGAKPTSRRVTFLKDKELVCTSLDWEQAFTDAKMVNSRGETPKLVTSDVLPKNEKVQKLTFQLPSGLDIGQLRSVTSKLSGSTGNAYVEVRHSSEGADLVTVLAAVDNPMPDIAPFDWDEIYSSKTIPFGTGVEGEPISFDLTDSSHLLLVGGSGSGKSISATALITPFLIQGYDIYIADPMKGAADFQYAEPWLKAVATDTLEASEMMNTVVKEMERRRNLNAQYGAATYRDLPEEVRPNHMVVFIDEVTSLLTVEKPVKATGKESEAEALELAKIQAEADARLNIGFIAGRIVREARSAGVTLLLAGQELKKETLDAIQGGSSIKNNMARIALGKMTQGGLMSALKSFQDAPQHLGDVIPRGRGIYEPSSGKPVLFQSFFDGPTPTDHYKSMVEHIEAVRPRLQPDEKVDLSALVTAKHKNVAVFGQVVGGAVPHIADNLNPTLDLIDDDEEIVDLGELSFDDLEFGDDEKTENTSTPQIVFAHPKQGLPNAVLVGRTGPHSAIEEILTHLQLHPEISTVEWADPESVKFDVITGETYQNILSKALIEAGATLITTQSHVAGGDPSGLFPTTKIAQNGAPSFSHLLPNEGK